MTQETPLKTPKEGRSISAFILMIALLLALGAFVISQSDRKLEQKVEVSQEQVAQEMKDRSLYNYKVTVQGDFPGVYYCNQQPDVVGPIVILFDAKQDRTYCFVNCGIKIEVLHEPTK